LDKWWVLGNGPFATNPELLPEQTWETTGHHFREWPKREVGISNLLLKKG